MSAPVLDISIPAVWFVAAAAGPAPIRFRPRSLSLISLPRSYSGDAVLDRNFETLLRACGVVEVRQRDFGQPLANCFFYGWKIVALIRRHEGECLSNLARPRGPSNP